MKVNFFYCISLIALLCMVSCGNSKDLSQVDGVEWKLEQLDGQAINFSDTNNMIVIVFDVQEKRVNGRAVCNRYFGDYKVDGKNLKFSTVGATKMFCPEIEKEDKYFKMIETTDSYKIDGEYLYFYAKDKEIAKFKEMAK